MRLNTVLKEAIPAVLAVTLAATTAQAQNASTDIEDRMTEQRAVEPVIWAMPAVNYYLMYQAGLSNKAAPNQIVYWSSRIRFPTGTGLCRKRSGGHGTAYTDKIASLHVFILAKGVSCVVAISPRQEATSLSHCSSPARCSRFFSWLPPQAGHSRFRNKQPSNIAR